MTWYQCEFIVPGCSIGLDWCICTKSHIVFLDKNKIILILMDNCKNYTILLHEPLDEVCIKVAQWADLKLKHILQG